MNYLQIKNWQEWQSYRKDRGTPPWIKVHRCLLSNPKWAILSDAEKGQLVSIWIVAADNGGQIPNDNIIIRKICQLDNPPDLNRFKGLGFFEDDGLPTGNQVVASPPQLDAPETETEVYSKEAETDKKGKSFVLPLPDWLPLNDWSDYLDARSKRGKKANNRAKQLVIIKLDELRTSGNDPGAVLRESILNGWTGVFKLKQDVNNENFSANFGKGNGNFNAGANNDKHQRTLEAAARGHARAQNPDF